MSSQNIKSVLIEERRFPPSAEFTAKARLKPADVQALRAEAAADHNGFWARQAQTELRWHKPFSVTLDESRAPNYRWFTDGELNVSYNCLDVHLEERGHKTAVTFVGEPGDVRHVSYRELHADVCRFANALLAQGVKTGDRVVIYMPMVPEAIVAMHACARIGAIHSVVFGGFSALSLKDRIEDAGAVALITADGGWRGGKPVELKEAADKALAGGCKSIRKVIVLKRTGQDVRMHPGRDIWWHDVIEGLTPVCDPVWVNAEHPLFLLYTSGSTGKPKGIQHSSAGYLLGAKLTSKWVFDLNSDDVFWCTADIGWVTGHSYVAYGPLAAGATIIIYEGAPTFPHAGRFWQICESLGVTIFYTAPTAIRALMKLGEDIPARYDLTRLRLLGSVGEPINPEAWMWYHEHVGRMRCPIVDTWWQTETGAIMISPLPGITATKPGSCTLPLPGIDATIVDARGDEVQGADAGGYLVVRKPWPAMLRTIWGDNDRYRKTYWETFQNRYYVAGDSAHRDKEGYFWIMGRIDDVLNVAGHRLGTMEIESALVAHPKVAESAVVGKQHEIKGESVFAFVVLRGERPTGDKIESFTKILRDWVSEQLGAIARPDDIRFVENLPKTRSGKILRRLLRSIARNEDITQDLSTLENPAIIDQLRGVEPLKKSAAAKKKAKKPPVRKSKASAKKKPPAKKKAAAGKAAPRKSKSRKPAAKKTPRRRPAARRKK
ncbi:MAG TPA: acetate--CoA ligase [Steroidobacteraceae bacterium]|jgi:acetyl-CoA synthetase|nr:acetate--CoA ligase [Steroidobacteraceae bacterium]